MQFDRLPLRGEGNIYNAVIETPPGSRVKFAYDPSSGLFLAKRQLPVGYAFPFPFGFFPSTKAGDGDPLDVLVLCDLDLPTGTLVHVELVGVLKMEQQPLGATPIRNDRVLAVPVLEHDYRPIRQMTDIPRAQLSDLERFFVAYQALDAVAVRPLGRGDAAEAEAIVAAAVSG